MNEIYIYGMGKYAKAFSDMLKDNFIKVTAYIISDEEPMKPMNDIPVYRFSTFFKKRIHDKVYVAMSWRQAEKVIDKLKNTGFTAVWINMCEIEDVKREIRNIKPWGDELYNFVNKPFCMNYGANRGDPIDRYYIHNFLRKYIEKMPNKSNIDVLEVGGDVYTKKYVGDKVSYSHILNYNDGEDLTNPSTILRKYDLFICTQTLNFIYDIKAAIKGCWSVLKPGGIFIGSVAGTVCPISYNDSARWGDYYRFTPQGIKRLFEDNFPSDYSIIVESMGNYYAAKMFVNGVSVEDLDDIRLLQDNDEIFNICIGIYAIKGSE